MVSLPLTMALPKWASVIATSPAVILGLVPRTHDAADAKQAVELEL